MPRRWEDEDEESVPSESEMEQIASPSDVYEEDEVDELEEKVRRESKRKQKKKKSRKRDKVKKREKKQYLEDDFEEEEEDEDWSVGNTEEDEDGPDIETPENFVRYHVASIFGWRKPLHSLFALTVLILTYGLLHVSGYNIVTILSFLVMFQLAATTVASQFSPALKEQGVVGKHFKAERFAETRQIIGSEDMVKISKGLSILAGDFVDQFEAIMENEDNVPFALLVGAFGLMALSGLYAPAYVVVFGSLFAAFMLTPLYLQNKNAVDEAVDQTMERLDLLLN